MAKAKAKTKREAPHEVYHGFDKVLDLGDAFVLLPYVTAISRSNTSVRNGVICHAGDNLIYGNRDFDKVMADWKIHLNKVTS